MIKRTLYFSNPAYLSVRDEQLIIKFPEIEKNDTLPESFKKDQQRSVPIEDIGVIILDNRQITLTHGVLEKLLDNNCAVITCNSNRMPYGLMLPLSGNTLQSERFRHQIDATLPLKKQLWQQTIAAKIENQGLVLKELRGCETGNMFQWASKVRSGDPENLEARAAAYYWSQLFSQYPDFTRKREGVWPNILLNYGYAILRAIVARGLVGTGLLPTLGIHHHNRYNAYCLADDIMEPYRPFVDRLVFELTQKFQGEELAKELKAELLQIPVLDVRINERRSPLMVAVNTTTTSLYKCYSGENRKIIYPRID
ncbi:type II CRISPR-associated endonuclease Cas1 [Bacteroidales bacterium OttesenSCG-928-B11]|nr:type II CRISPR-associated endonuclease Cas1 [Bacteroidales bacterium OttesenSCG-928-B11]MDL2326655.1 type II CRISPR-associated endonuclease Cas1 [Bacteroidales bacterium OttesenSCG-928-A14]